MTQSPPFPAALANTREPLRLGYELSETSGRFGFMIDPERVSSALPIFYEGEAHLATVAPTRAGKGVGPIITNLLHYPGPVIVVDPKGENFAVTARRRREMGQRVICLDPFGQTGTPSDHLDPLDSFQLPGADVDGDSKELAMTCGGGPSLSKDPFWDRTGGQFLAGVITVAAMHPEQEKRCFPTVIDLLNSDDVTYNLAVLLDTIGKKLPVMAYRSISAVLQMPEITRGGVIATAQSYLESVMATPVRTCLAASTFDLLDVTQGKPLSIYLVIPPDKLASHRGLVRLWVGVLMKALLARRNRIERPTLVLLDEAAQLGHFPLIEAMVTLGAGYGTRVWTFWQDLAQVRANYPDSWRTILNNCGAIQTFGVRNRDMATQWGDLLSHGPEQLLSLRETEQVLLIHGRGELRARKLDYRTDPSCAGLGDENPLHLDLPAVTSSSIVPLSKRSGNAPSMGEEPPTPPRKPDDHDPPQL